jgi:hypothetical protein
MNEGLRPVPHSVDSINRDGQTIYRDQQMASGTISSVDRAAFYQLKTMMQRACWRAARRTRSLVLRPMSRANPGHNCPRILRPACQRRQPILLLLRTKMYEIASGCKKSVGVE